MGKKSSKPLSAQAQAAVDELEQKVTAKIDERARMLAVVRPVLEKWRKRVVMQLEELQFNNPLYSNTFEKVDDWQSAMFLLGNIYKLEQGASRNKAIEGKALLAYVWRVTFEFSTAVGNEERKSLIKAFGLDDNASHTPNKALLKKLNALQHRPLIVAQSIMEGEKPFKFDEVLASFVRQVVSVDKYTYTTADGATANVTEQYMSDWISANWEMVKTATTKSALVGLWTDMGYSLSLAQKAEKSAEAKQKRIDSAVERATVSPDGKALIDTISNLSANDKAVACSLLDKQMLARGYAPVSPGAPLYYTQRIVFGKDKAPSEESLEKALVELGRIKSDLEVRLASLRQKDAARAMPPVLKKAVDTGIITAKQSDNGQVTHLMPVDLEELPTAA